MLMVVTQFAKDTLDTECSYVALNNYTLSQISQPMALIFSNNCFQVFVDFRFDHVSLITRPKT